MRKPGGIVAIAGIALSVNAGASAGDALLVADPSGTPMDVSAPLGGPITDATLLGASSLKTHGQGFGMQEIVIDRGGRVQNQDVSTEPRAGGLSELRLVFDIEPGGYGDFPVTIEEQVCPGGSEFDYVPYSGSSVMRTNRHVEELVITFTPGLENARTYRLTLTSEVTTIAGQSIEVRVLLADANGNGRVNGNDRSAVIAAWTSPAHFSVETDFNLSGRTDGNDRSMVIAAWTGTGTNCAP